MRQIVLWAFSYSKRLLAGSKSDSNDFRHILTYEFVQLPAYVIRNIIFGLGHSSIASSLTQLLSYGCNQREIKACDQEEILAKIAGEIDPREDDSINLNDVLALSALKKFSTYLFVQKIATKYVFLYGPGEQNYLSSL